MSDIAGIPIIHDPLIPRGTVYLMGGRYILIGTYDAPPPPPSWWRRLARWLMRWSR